MTRHIVLIPLVQRASEKGDLLEIYCETSLPTAQQDQERENGMNPVTEALRDVNLHIQGREAFAATEKLLPADAKPRLNLSGYKVTHSNFPASTSKVEGDSAGLGIALVLLMAAGQSETKTVLASGAIKINPGDNRFDADIVAVNDLAQKFTVVLEKSALKDGLFFIPKANVDADSALLSSEAAKTLQAQGMHFIPVATLSEVLGHLNIAIPEQPPLVADTPTLPETPVARSKGRALIYAGLAASLVAVGLAIRFMSPTPQATIRFLANNAPYVDDPFIICNPSSRFPDYKKFSGPGLAHYATMQDTVGWRLQIELPANAKATATPYHLLVAFVGEQTGLKLLTVNKQGDFQLPLPVGKPWAWKQQLEGKPEAGVLVFLANASAFDVNSLREHFQGQFAAPPYKIDIVQEFLKQQAAASHIYFFETRQQASDCESHHELLSH